MSEQGIVIGAQPQALTKKERKRMKKMSRRDNGATGVALQPQVHGALVESGATAGAVKFHVVPEFQKIDADKKLTPVEKEAAKKRVAWRLWFGGLVAEQLTAGNFQRVGSGARSAGAAALGMVY